MKIANIKISNVYKMGTTCGAYQDVLLDYNMDSSQGAYYVSEECAKRHAPHEIINGELVNTLTKEVYDAEARKNRLDILNVGHRAKGADNLPQYVKIGENIVAVTIKEVGGLICDHNPEFIFYRD
jgi:acetate kinase